MPQPEFSRANFIVSSSNAGVLKTVDAWIASSDGQLLIVNGPQSSGKTHLGTIIATALGVVVDRNEEIDDYCKLSPILPLVIDNLEELATPPHLLTLLAARSQHATKTVLIGQGEPRDWADGLNDLATRLEAGPRIALNEPDEDLLKEVIKRLFDNKQLRVSSRVVDFAALRMPKTFRAAALFVEACDQRALSENRSISVKLAQTVMASLFA